jgi:predicted dehydrogenase
MIGLQRRFDDNFMRVREAIKNKEVGDPIMVSYLVVTFRYYHQLDRIFDTKSVFVLFCFVLVNIR